jgi:hypothetical protein
MNDRQEKRSERFSHRIEVGWSDRQEGAFDESDPLLLGAVCRREDESERDWLGFERTPSYSARPTSEAASKRMPSSSTSAVQMSRNTAWTPAI